MQGRGNGTIKAMDDAAESSKASKRVEQARKMSVGGKRSPIRPKRVALAYSKQRFDLI